jgi:hypothetical protein
LRFFALKEYLKYRWNAKTRHGVHSPFVFDFVEKVLRDKSSGSLERKLINYFNGYPVTWRDITEAEFDLENIPAAEIIVVRNIHSDKAALAKWEQLAKNNAVKLSIDIYSHGLLFFRSEFKVKQHFVLKNPG